MDIKLSSVHIGQEIKKRLEELKVSKSEFGRRIGVRQQHVNRIFDMASIDTEKLVTISGALDFNFFTLFVDIENSINADKSALTWGSGNAQVLIGDEALSARIKVLEAELAAVQKENARLEAEKSDKYEQVSDKKQIIDFLKEKLSKYEQV